MRLDLFLVENGYFDSRTRAQREIENGAIKVDDKIITKPSFAVLNPKIEIVKEILPYVSQGGLKLLGAIENFKLNFKNKVVLDIGASTGGFTDCALQNGARLVYAVDVGTSQLVSSLKNNPRVISLENTNINTKPQFKEKIDIIVMDVSFVSVTVLLESLDFYLDNNNYLILLIKPQFEVGHFKMKNGILKDKKKHLEVLNNVSDSLNKIGLYVNNIMKSPIKGGSGNQEYLAKVSRKISKKINFLSII